MEVRGRLQFVRDVADEIGFLLGEEHLAADVRGDERASRDDRHDQQKDDEAEGELQRVRRFRHHLGIGQVKRGFPVGQRLADFGRHERMFPVGLEVGDRERHGLPRVIEQGEAVAGGAGRDGAAAFLLEFRRLEHRAQSFEELRLVELRAKNQVVSGRWPVPDHQLQLVVEKTGQGPRSCRCRSTAGNRILPGWYWRGPRCRC